PSIEVHTISWLPQTLKIRPFALRPEPGGNLELHQTLGVVLSQGQAVSMWGPYRTSPDVYARSLEVKGTLEGGLTQYRAMSPANDPGLANCNQAVLRVGPEVGRRARPLWRVGNAAGRYVSRNVEAHS